MIVAYDIDTSTAGGVKRLSRISKVCERYGVRVQKSVFESRLGEARAQRMIGELMDVMDVALDSIVIYRIPGSLDDARSELGRSMIHPRGKPWIL